MAPARGTLAGIGRALTLGMFIRPIVFTHAGLVLLVGLVGSAVVACSSADDAKTAAWSCTSSDVPMGEVVRCTQSALTMDGPTGGTSDTCYGSTDSPEICADPFVPVEGSFYECDAGEPECPPVATSGGTGGTSDGTSGSSTDGQQSDQGGSAPSAGGAGGNGNGNGNGKSGDSGGSSGPDECSYVSDLPYCGSDSGGTTDGSSDGTSGHGKDGAPGQTKKNGTSDGSSSSGGGKGKHYKCAKDDKGNKQCESVPDCAPGTHPSACGACVPDGESSDCVPPAAGGCWVTGGGFIVGPNVATGADADGHDNFGGNAKPMKDGRIQGHWNHVDHGTGNHAKGVPQYIVCRRVDEPGPGQPGGKKGFTMNQVYFGGPAEWRSDGAWASGYWFDVVAKDHGEPGSRPHAKNGGMPDTYHFTIRLIDDPQAQTSGAIVYETKGELEGGNIQMHPPNNGHPNTPMTLPSWVAYED